MPLEQPRSIRALVVTKLPTAPRRSRQYKNHENYLYVLSSGLQV